MSNELVIKYDETFVPAINSEIINDFALINDDAFAGMQNLSSRYIKVTKAGYELVEGKSRIPVAANELYGVFVGSAPYNHSVWYRKAFSEGTEPLVPDLIWHRKDPEVFPEQLPKQFHTKINRFGQERWDFVTKRRLVFVLWRPSDSGMLLDVEHPYVFDITSKSLYAFGSNAAMLAAQNMYKWRGIKDVCAQESTVDRKVFPSMFTMRILHDMTATVSGIVVFSPMRAEDGRLQFLHPDDMRRVHACAISDSTRSMCEVQEKLSFDDAEKVETPIMAANNITTSINTIHTPAPTPAPTTQPVATPEVQQAQPVAPAPATPIPHPTNQTNKTNRNAENQAKALLEQARQLLNSQQQEQSAAPKITVPPVNSYESVIQNSVANLLAELE